MNEEYERVLYSQLTIGRFLYLKREIIRKHPPRFDYATTLRIDNQLMVGANLVVDGKLIELAIWPNVKISEEDNKRKDSKEYPFTITVHCTDKKARQRFVEELETIIQKSEIHHRREN